MADLIDTALGTTTGLLALGLTARVYSDVLGKKGGKGLGLNYKHANGKVGMGKGLKW